MHVGIATGFAYQRDESYTDKKFIQEEIENAVLAEQLGFDSIWITEHHFSNYSLSPDPLMYLSYIAGRTSRIKLGTQVLVIPWHDPVRMVEQILILDHVSGGRAVLGFGRGLARKEYEGMRIDMNTARERYDELLTLVVPALESGVMEGGEIYQVPRVELRPRPVKSFKGRLFSGSITPASLEASIKLGLARLIIELPSGGVGGPAQEDVFGNAWRKFYGADSNPPGPMVSGLTVVDESSERAKELGYKYCGDAFRNAIKHYELTSEHLGSAKGYESYQKMRLTSEDDIEKAIDAYASKAVAGTPQEVLEQYDALKTFYKPQGFFPHMYFGGMPQEEGLRNMHYFAEHCLAEMKSWPGETSFD